jgi:DNA mismatch repair ATPase MutS
VAVEAGTGAYGVAALDASTGELSACEAPDVEALVAELVRLDAREVLVGPEAQGSTALIRASLGKAVVREEREAPISLPEAESILSDALADLPGASAAGARPPEVALRAAARCVAMARACEPGRILPLARLSV